MSVEITHRRMSSGGTRHEHITDVKWKNINGTGGSGQSSKAQMVSWIENNGNAYCGNGLNRVPVGVVDPDQGAKYLRTYADGNWTNNLLSLPEF